MKNKKLIATVASLCLVLVAVVAAVIGVLAAAQQKANTRVSVVYQANDVYASIKAAGRNEKKVTESSGTYTVVEDDWVELLGESPANTVTFERTANTQTASAAKFSSTLGSNNKFIVYKMTFNNLNQSYALNVLADYTKSGTADDTKNVLVGYVWIDGPDAAWSDITALVVPGQDGHTQSLNTTEGSLKLTAISNTTTLDHTIVAKGSGTAGTAYLYVVVAVADLDQDAGYELGTENETTHNKLEFVLQRATRTPANP